MTTEASDHRFGMIVDSINDVLWLGSVDMSVIEYVNPAFETVCGLAAEDLYRSSHVLVDLLHPDDRDRVRRVVEEHSDREWFVSCRVVRPEGSISWVEAHGFEPVDGKRAGICRDVTKSVADQQRLESSETMLAETSRIARIGGWEFDAATSRISITETLREIFEIPVGWQPQVDDAIDSCVPDDRPIMRELVEIALDTGDPWDVELRALTVTGNPIVVRWQGRAVMENGQTIRLVGSTQDITRQVLERESLARSETRFRTILETTPDSVVVMNHLGVVEEWNGAAEAMFGYSAADAIGRTVAELIIPMAQRHAHDAALAGYNRTGLGDLIGSTAQVDAIRSDGSMLTVELAIQPMEGSQEQTFVGTIRDVSQRIEDEGRLRAAFEGTITAMAHTIETRDPYTAGHQQRVADLTSAIAEQMGMTGDEVLGMTFGAMIHDIGKISVPAEILNRPGKLTVLEFELIKSHPQLGAEILSDVEFPWPVDKVVLQHHERLDGSGYPSGLKGAKISIEARIVAVADVVEAMSSHRPYRPALGVEAALAEISQSRGSLFDTDVVEACLAVFRDHEFEFEYRLAGTITR